MSLCRRTRIQPTVARSLCRRGPVSLAAVFAAAATTVAASPLGLSSFSFFTKEHSREYSCTAKGQRCYSHPSVSCRCPRSRTHRNAQTHKGNAVARSGNGAGSIARPPARDRAETRALLGDRVRLAQGRGQTERPTEFHHRDRRSRHSLHSRSFETQRRFAAHRHARLARLGHRAAEDYRSADQSDGTWRVLRRTPSTW